MVGRTEDARKRLERFYRGGGKDDRIRKNPDGSGWWVETDRDRQRGAPVQDNYERKYSEEEE